MGPTGGGKTTLLDLLACKLTPEAGRVLLNGQAASALKEQVNDITGRVSQEDYLFSTLTVRCAGAPPSECVTPSQKCPRLVCVQGVAAVRR